MCHLSRFGRSADGPMFFDWGGMTQPVRAYNEQVERRGPENQAAGEDAGTGPPGDITAALNDLRADQEGAGERLMSLVHSHLRRIARGYLRREHGARELETTDLFHEAWLRLFGRDVPELNDRRHLYGAFARAVRQFLVDHARGRDAVKRGGDMQRVTLTGLHEADKETSIDVLALNQALERLEEQGERRARIVELRFFVGLSIPEIAEALGIGTTTVERDWALAKAWLQVELAS